MASEIKKLNEKFSSLGTNFKVDISIKDVSVVGFTIIKLVVKEWIFDLLPRIELEFADSGTFTEKFPLEDNDEIKVQVNYLQNEDPIIKTSFTLQDYEISNVNVGQSVQTIIKLTGLLKTSNFLYEIKTRAFSNKTSTEIFKNLSDECGFSGFVQRIQSKDKMNWLQVNQNNLDFMKHILCRSYVNDNDLPLLFSNRKGELVFTSLNTQIKDKNQKVKTAIFDMDSSLMSDVNTDEEFFDEKKELIAEQYGKDGVIYYRNWNYKNVAGTINKLGSYGTSYSYYDLENGKEQTITSDEHPLSRHSLKEKDKIGKIVLKRNFGTQDAVNMHSNYFLSQTQNEYIRADFCAAPLVIYSQPENSLQVGDKLNLRVPTMFNIDSAVDEVHSGEYLITGIIHELQKNSIYSTILILCRNGLNISSIDKDFSSRHSSSPVSNAKIGDLLDL